MATLQSRTKESSIIIAVQEQMVKSRAWKENRDLPVESENAEYVDKQKKQKCTVYQDVQD